MRSGNQTLVLALAAALLLVAAATEPAAAQEQHFNSDLLVQPEWLLAHGQLENVRIIDFNRTPEEYGDGHIPGAAFVDLGRITTEVGSVPKMLAHPERLASVLEGVGVNDASTVVVYDDAQGLWASRLFWTLEYLGHDDVRMLDGGWAAWLAAGGEVSVEVPSLGRGDFVPVVRHEFLASEDWILGTLEDERVAVLDVRTVEEFEGESVRAERGGHIPGAVHIDWASAIENDEMGRVLAPAELRSLFGGLGVTPDRTVVTYCQSGIKSAHTYFVLRLMGYPDVRMYDGSWVEWGNSASTPIEAETSAAAPEE